MIEVMRQRHYPGSPINVEKKLDSGANYDRYIASYLVERLKIYALLTIPQGEKPPAGWPVIVFNHGYIPPEQYRTTERYVAYVDALARSGYMVFRPDYRGHGSSEGQPSSAYGSPDYTVDVLNAVSAVRQHPDADPNRIGMWGHSMGGHITLRAMVISHDIRAGVIWAGVVGSYADLLDRWRRPATPIAATVTPAVEDARRRWRQGLLDTYGSPADNPAFWDSISPNAYLSDLSGPVQLHHGSADKSVPVEFSQTLFTQIQQAGQVAELYTYANDDHNISHHFSLAMRRSIEFFDQYVKGRQ